MARTKTNLSNEDFLKAYLATQAAGKTFEDLAVEVNMVGQSAYQRFNKLSKVMAAEGVTLPSMPLKPKKTLNVDALKAIVAAYAEPKNEQENVDNQQYVDA